MKKGFTLIELLAVIIILGVLMIIAIPAITKIIQNAREDTAINSVKTFVKEDENQNKYIYELYMSMPNIVQLFIIINH